MGIFLEFFSKHIPENTKWCELSTDCAAEGRQYTEEMTGFCFKAFSKTSAGGGSPTDQFLRCRCAS